MSPEQPFQASRCHQLEMIEICDQPTLSLQACEQSNGRLAEARNAPDLEMRLSRPEVVRGLEMNRSARRQDSDHLGNHGRHVRDVLDHGVTDDEIERAVTERQSLSGCDDERDPSGVGPGHGTADCRGLGVGFEADQRRAWILERQGETIESDRAPDL